MKIISLILLGFLYINVPILAQTENEKSVLSIDLDIKVFIEGAYLESQMNTVLNPSNLPLSQPFNVLPWNYSGTESVTAIPNEDIVDWLLIETRDTSSSSLAYASTIMERQACFLLKNGNVVSIDGSSFPHFSIDPIDDLFIVIYHRNHLPILSANPLTESGGIYSYDFTIAANTAYMSSQTEIGAGIYGMFAGDYNVDGEINVSDLSTKWIPSAGETGYFFADGDLDGQVNNTDKNILWFENVGEFAKLPVETVWECGDVFTDSRDARTYMTIGIGSQCWMAENLAIGSMIVSGINQTDNTIIERYCYDDNLVNCGIYGGLYQWNEMMNYGTTESVRGICPTGWHLPSDEEYQVLEMGLGLSETEAGTEGWRGINQGEALKEAGTVHWSSPNAATNSTGFTALPGGYHHPTSFFTQLHFIASFWTSTHNSSAPWNRELQFFQGAIWKGASNPNNARSVRCVKDISDLGLHTEECGEVFTYYEKYRIITGETWLNKNLSADFVATSYDDYLAYGGHYQWGRTPDDHQCINWTSATTGSHQYGMIATLSSLDNPGHNLFIINSDFPRDWRSPKNDNLWQGVAGINNPCPNGYRIPTEAEWDAERLSWISNDRNGAYQSDLRIPSTGKTNATSGNITLIGSQGKYWSSTVSGDLSKALSFNSTSTFLISAYRANGNSVRCIKD